jgi:branched-chain amino acid transport system permease protein
MSIVSPTPTNEVATALDHPTPPPTPGRRSPRRHLTTVGLVALVVVLALLPKLAVTVPGVLPGPTYSPGTLQLLAVCLLVGALAVTYHLLFGVAGMLSFGHALYFAVGVYGFAVALQTWHLGLLPAALATLAMGALTALVVGAVSLRVSGIAFAMVTLAFAQAGSLLVYRNIGGLSGGEEGLGLADAHLPPTLLGVANTVHLYWLALGIAVVVVTAAGWIAASRVGAMMVAVRENELRVRVLGVRPYVVRLVAFVASGTLATVVGMGYLLVEGGANPRITTTSFTLSLLVMVVLGGLGSRWGALTGGVIYTLLDQRLGVLASSATVTSLPPVLRVPLSQPLFLLGVLFVLVVLFVPGGLTALVGRIGAARSRVTRGHDEVAR